MAKKFNFNNALQELENLVSIIENEEDLEISIKKCKKGVELIKECQEYLKEKKNEIKIIED